MAKQFQFLSSGRTDKVHYKVLGDLFSGIVEKGARAAADCDKSCEGTSALAGVSEETAKVYQRIRGIADDLQLSCKDVRGMNPITQSQKRAIERIAERAGKVRVVALPLRDLYERIHVFKASEKSYKEQASRQCLA